MPRPKKIIKQDPERADTFNYAMQLNKYRMMYKELGFICDELWIEFIITEPRYKLKEWKFDGELVMIPIPIISDSEVDNYFFRKATDLKLAMGNRSWNHACDPRERWANDKGEDKKCMEYCDVAEHCGYWKEHYKKDVDPNQNSLYTPYGNVNGK